MEAKRRTIFAGFFLMLFAWIWPCQGQLTINEIQSSNFTTAFDPNFNLSQWVELFNGGNNSIQLSGYYISDDLEDPYKCRINEGTALAGQYYILWLERNSESLSNFFSTDMVDGGLFALFSPSGELIDSITYPPQLPDVSYGRIPSDTDTWGYFASPTPGNSNTTQAMEEPQVPEEVSFSLQGGFYSGTQYLELSSGSATGTIKYTDDGSWPTKSSNTYNGPIQITDNAVIRARLFEENMLPGNTCTQTYFINEEISYPVVSISTQPEYFYGAEEGIYVQGVNGTNGNCMGEIRVNWNNDWERPINFEYYSKDGVQQVNQMVGTKIYGGCSRMRLYKSLGIYARNQYGGNRLNYKFFESKDVDEFKSIVLRNSGNDAYFSLFRDAFMQSLLIGKMDVDYQAYQPAIIFINGQYTGILNVREKISEHYPASNFNIDPDEIDMLVKDWYSSTPGVVSGSADQYTELVNYMESHDLNDPDAYAFVCTQIDVNEFMNYCLAEIYFQNEDWLTNNTKFWRPKMEGGKWRWSLYDCDFGWALFDDSGSVTAHALEPGPATVVVRNLLENEGFRDEWIQRMAGFINTIFHPSTVTPIYDSILSMVQQEIYRHMDYWGAPLEYKFRDHTEKFMPDFTDERPNIVRNEFKYEFKLSGMYQLWVDVNDPSMGYVMASGAKLPPDFSGYFFDDVPLRLTAIPKGGYRFSHWEGLSTSTSSEIYIDRSSNATIQAVYEPASALSGIYINEISASAKEGIRDNYGQSEDWIEIYNDNEFDVDLAGCFLSDSSGYAQMYSIPLGLPDETTIKAKSYLVFWMDDHHTQGPLHTNFKLKRTGEFISLVQPLADDLHIIDSLSYPAINSFITYGRDPVDKTWDYLMPSPAALNSSEELITLYVNEYVTKNEGVIEDEFGEADDWIEIYNPTNESVDIGGMFLTDSLMDPLKHRIPEGVPATVIPSGGHLILWADNQEDQGVLHLGFKLNSSSEQIGLYQVGAGYVDSLSYQLEYGEAAFGRYPDGAEQQHYLTATPGAANEIRTVNNLHINEIMASNRTTSVGPDSAYSDWIEIYNGNSFPVDIGGLFITDSLANRTKGRIRSDVPDSTTIPAGGFLVLQADNQEEKGVLHLGFKLAADGEEIGLIQPNGLDVIDSLSFPKVYPNMAYGLYTDGSTNVQIVSPSPGASNYILPTDILYISELVASGNNSNADAYGEFDDWIEIHNPHNYPVDLGGYFITDSLPDKQKHYIPTGFPDSTTIQAGEKLILWADGDEDQGILHLGFRLSGSGEQVALVGRDGAVLVDSVSYPDQYSNFSYSRLNDTEEWRFLRPTIADSNLITQITGIHINEFSASNNTFPDDYGELGDWIELHNSNSHEVDLGGLYLTDSLGNPSKYRIPSHTPEETVIPAEGYYVLYADNQKEQGIRHTNFGLRRSGEQIGLFHYDGSTILDSITYEEQYKNSTFGRIFNTGAWFSIPPSPGRFNDVPDIDGLVINEVMAANKTVFCDNAGEYDDWIEIFNSGSQAIDLGGLYLTDSLADPFMHRIPTTYPDSTILHPGEHMILWADEEEEQGILHLGFKISKTGDQLGLFGYTGELIDSIYAPFISSNSSWGRLADADPTWIQFLEPTPSMSNIMTSYASLTPNDQSITVYPNPMGKNGYFEIPVKDQGRVRIEIFDANGKAKMLLQNEHQVTGTLLFEWDLKDASGNHLPGGLYLYRVVTGDGVYSGKIMVDADIW